MKGISTELLFKDKSPRQELSMRRKQDDYGVFIGPEIGIGGGELHIGKGVVTGIQLEAVLRSLSKVKGFHHFDELAIPFRAVATDLVTGKAVIFSEGELANVMRASMSVPDAVAPAESGGMMLVDGAPDLRPVDEIRIEPLQSVNPRAVAAVMKTESGRPIEQQELDRDMGGIYGLGNFETVNYSFLEEPGRRILVVNAVEKTWGLKSIRLGLGLSSDFQSASYLNLVGSYRRYWLNSLGAEWRTDLQVGRTSSLTSESYQPLSPEGIFFVAPNVYYERRTSDIHQGDDRIASYGTTASGLGLDLGSVLGQYGELRVGMLKGRVKPDLEIGPPALEPGPSIDQGAFRVRLALEAGKVSDPLVAGNPDGVLKSGSLFLGLDTPIGPAYLAYGQAAGGTNSLYFFLGRAF